MANEAAITIVGRMRDEISDKMGNMAGKTQQAAVASLELKVALTSVGSAMTAVGSVLNMIDSPITKTIGYWMAIGGALFTTTTAIIIMIPVIKQLVGWLKSLAVAQAIVKALSGPIGWVQLGAGLAFAGAATAAIYGLSAAGRTSGGGMTVNVNSQAFAGNTAEARKFASKIQRYSREETRIGR